MKKLFFALFIIYASQQPVNACNVCGCSATNQYLGILPQSKTNFIGIQYQYRSFVSTHMPEAGEQSGEVSYEMYHLTQLWGRYHFNRRIQAFIFLPYIANKQEENSIQSVNSGLGDISVLLNYKVLDRASNNDQWQHTLQAGGGIKLPTGTYNYHAIKYGDELPNMQPGTGSYDIIVNGNYTLQHGKTGLNTDISFVTTTSNADKYKFGNRLQAGLLLYHSVKLWDLHIIPQFGARYECAGCDYDNYAYGIRNDMSGGYKISGSVGLQAYYSSFGIQLAFHKPVVQHFANGMVSNKLKIESGIYWLF